MLKLFFQKNFIAWTLLASTAWPSISWAVECDEQNAKDLPCHSILTLQALNQQSCTLLKDLHNIHEKITPEQDEHLELDYDRLTQLILTQMDQLPQGIPDVPEKRTALEGALKQVLKDKVWPAIVEIKSEGRSGRVKNIDLDNLKLEDRSLIKYLPSQIWQFPDGRVLMDWPSLILGQGSTKTVYFSLDYETLMKRYYHTAMGGPSPVRASWTLSGKSVPNAQKEFAVQEKLYEKRKHKDRGIALNEELLHFGNSIKFLNERDENVMHVAQPYFNFGDLRYLAAFPYKVKLDAADQLLSDLEFIHQNGIIHQDIKPQNILINEDDQGKIALKIADYGSAFEATRVTTQKDLKNRLGNYYGTGPFFSPERANMSTLNNIDRVALAQKSDLWAAGLSLYSLFKKAPSGCRLRHPAAQFSIPIKISNISKPSELCSICQLFCDSKNEKLEIPPKGTAEYLIFQMLDPNVFTRKDASKIRADFQKLRRSYERTRHLFQSVDQNE
jgi:hypothetical protein